MNYQEIQPGLRLQPYVQCYYITETGTDGPSVDRAFASGRIELMFNIGAGRWQTEADNSFVTTAPAELWGQIIRPLSFRSVGENKMLGIRFYPHTAAVFFNEYPAVFNNKVIDFSLVAGKEAGFTHRKLTEEKSLLKQVEIIETFLLHRLSISSKHFGKLPVMHHILGEFNKRDFVDNIENVAGRYNITSRYLQKLFAQYTGLSPKLYSRIQRFRNSIGRIANTQASLTSIAYDCGYFDQSHFIREFKSFTGISPSEFQPLNSSATLIPANK